MSMYGQTIAGLFGNEMVHFEIPEYQRAYCWEKEQWAQFLQDLEDAESGYYLGHFLFEEDGDRFLVIDGQQRLTTCVIFIRSAIDALSALGDGQSEKDVRILKRRFLEDPDLGPRLKTVPFDNPTFQDCIVSGRSAPGSFCTLSSKKMVDAKMFFTSELQRLGNATAILGLVRRMQNAVITRYEVGDRAMAARVFAFQNDRGKELTQLESIKAFLMLTVYMKGKSDPVKNATVEIVDGQFTRIYETIARIEVDEDQVLAHYWRSQNGYGAGRPSEEVKRELSSTEDPVEWVRTFVRELADAFAVVEEFSADSGEYSVRLRLLNNLALAYPFLMRARRVGVQSDSSAFRTLLKLLENLTFRSLIRGGRADIQSRLTGHLLRIDDEASLCREVEQIVEAVKNGWWGYWSDDELARRLDEWFYGNRVDNYLLWQYERSLYGKGYTSPVTITAREMMKNESIEHIAPQTPTDGNPVANGYGEYDDRSNPENGIESGGWLNRLGNLVLASQSQNSSLGNRPFPDKLRDYERVILEQQKRIADFADRDERGEPSWTVSSIRRRQKAIVDWAKDNWDIAQVLK